MLADGVGLDTITDFTAGAGSENVIEFGSWVFAGYAEVIAAATQTGSHVVITLDPLNTVTVQSVILANLHADDLHFV